MNHPSTHPLNPKKEQLVGWLFGLGLLLSQFYTAPLFSNSPIRFSDLGATLIILACALGGARIPTVPFIACATAFIGWSVLVFFSTAIFSYPIDAANHFINVFRIIIGITLLGTLSFGLKNTNPRTISTAINTVFAIHLVAFFSYILLFSINFFNGFFNIVAPGDERNAMITNNHLLSNHFRTIIADGDNFRFSGIFEEPAFFSWNIIALIACIAQINKNAGVKLNHTKKIFTFLCTTFFTRSFAGIFGAILILLPSLREQSPKKTLGALLSLALLFSTAYLFSDAATINRIESLISLSDGSSNTRIIGSINAFMGMLDHSPIYGFGLGDLNKEIATTRLESLGVKNGIDLFGLYIIDIHNGLIQVAFSLGLIGLIFYFALLLPSLRAGTLYAAGMFVVLFSSNVFNAYFVWIFIGLGAYAARFNCRNKALKV